MSDFDAISLEPEARENLIEELAAYSETDLLCYFAEEEALCQRQCEAWEPVLKWVEGELGVTIARTQGVVPVPQPTELSGYFTTWLSAMDDPSLVAVAQMVTGLGSILLTLAVLKGGVTLDAALAASQLDEEFQQEEWGEDAAIQAKLAEKDAKIRAAHDYLA